MRDLWGSSGLRVTKRRTKPKLVAGPSRTWHAFLYYRGHIVKNTFQLSALFIQTCQTCCYAEAKFIGDNPIRNIWKRKTHIAIGWQALRVWELWSAPLNCRPVIKLTLIFFLFFPCWKLTFITRSCFFYSLQHHKRDKNKSFCFQLAV